MDTEREGEHRIALHDRAEYLKDAQRWLAGGDGPTEMKSFIMENLLVNLRYEAKEGQEIREYNKSGPSHARQARKQFKETADLVLALAKDLEQDAAAKKKGGGGQ